MNPNQTFEIKAQINHLSSGIGCFDPMQVIARMRIAFPDMIVEDRDPLWETYDHIRQQHGNNPEKALRVAIRDIQERGPKLLFSIPVSDSRVIKGTAERYWVLVHSSEEFPSDFRHRFTTFLQGLTLQPIEVT